MHKNIKSILMILIVPALIAVFFFDNIRGYYRFKELCNIEKTKQIVNKVEPNMGWVFNEDVPSTTLFVFPTAALPHVKFVRFKDYDNKQIYDARYLGGRIYSKESFDVKLADLAQKPVYAWKQIQEEFPKELRTSRYGDQIIDLRTNKVIVNLTNIGYGLFDRNHTLLDAPSGNTCEWYEYLGKDSNKKLIFGE